MFERQDRNQDLTETFYYDSLDRLDYSTLNGLVNLDLSYDAAGRIESKAMAGANPTSTAEMTWYTYGLPRTLETAEGSSEFFYGVNRERIKQISGSGSSTETITYVGDLLEKRVSGATTEHRHYVYGANGPVAIVKRNNAGASSTYYIATDHLGSTESITNSVGSLLVRTSFGAFGERRGGNWMGTPSSSELAQIAATTRRGFTFHEHLDNVGLIHMNGRVYDPGVARFTSADPLVQNPFFSQSLYRYAYTFNSPLSYIDPSGFAPDEPPDPPKCDAKKSKACFVNGMRLIDPDEVPRAYAPNEQIAGRWRGEYVSRVLANESTVNRTGGVSFEPMGWRASFFGYNKFGRLIAKPFDLFAPFGTWVYDGALVNPLSGLELSPGQQKDAEFLTLATGPVGLVRSAAVKGTVVLYRAVSEAEAVSIRATGAFSAGSNSLGGKWFAESVDHARQWGDVLNGPGASRIFEVTLPRSVADQFMRMERLDGIGPARYGELDQLGDAIIREVFP